MASDSAAHLLIMGKARRGANWHLGPRKHQVAEIVVILGGSERVAVRGGTFVARPGQVLLFAPGVVHEEWAEGPDGIECVYIGFEPRSHRFGDGVVVADSQGSIREMTLRLYEARDCHWAGKREYFDAFLGAILMEHRRLAECTESKMVGRVRHYVRSHLADPFRLDDLAAVAGMSKYYFCRTYRALTGTTPMADARHVRVEEARRLCLTTDLRLKQIAPRVGFASKYHLARLLKAHLAVSVREAYSRRTSA